MDPCRAKDYHRRRPHSALNIAEVAVERRHTHRRQRRDLLDAQRRVVVAADPVGWGMTSEPAGRKVRADAQKNRQRLLDVAVRALSEQGADVAPATIARLADVGVGTLYRHFS